MDIPAVVAGEERHKHDTSKSVGHLQITMYANCQLHIKYTTLQFSVLDGTHTEISSIST
jgi:hypothetical protein